MDSDNLKPIKTEYKGIVFDSKSEAVFARCLDLAEICFVYHPTDPCHGNWYENGWKFPKPIDDVESNDSRCPTHEWDFLTFTNQRRKLEIGGSTYYFNSLLPTLVELKPSLPNKTYIENIKSKCSDTNWLWLLVYGNVWSDPCNCFNALSLSPNYPSNLDTFEFSEDLILKAKSTRFDLC